MELRGSTETTVTSSEQRTTKTATKYSERSEKVNLADEELEGGARGSFRRERVVTRYEADANKVAPKIIMIKRTEAARQDSFSQGGQGGSFVETSINMSIGSKQSTTSATDMKDSFDKVATNWQREKSNLQELNNRLSGHIEKVRFLEQQNKKLVDQLEGLRSNWVNDTMKVKEEHGSQLVRRRKDLNDAELTKVHVEVELASAEDRSRELHALHEEALTRNALDLEDISNLRELVAEYESELNLLRKRFTTFDSENDKDKIEIERLKNSIESLRVNLDVQTENHVQAELSAQNAREELEFLQSIHEAEIKELEGLIYKESSSESRGFWRNELAQALEEIQSEYDGRLEDVKQELEIHYEKKVTEANQAQVTEVEVAKSEEVSKSRAESEELKRTTKELEVKLNELTERQRKLATHLTELQKQLEEGRRSHDKEKILIIRQITESQSELDHIMKELRVLLDAKLSLDLQIAAYRKLIESEENRINRDSSSEIHSTTNQLFGGRTGGSSSTSTSIKITGSSSSAAAGGGGGGGSAAAGGGSAAGGFSQTTSQTTSQSTSELTAKTSFSRNAKGAVGVKECANDGRYVKLEHLGKKNPKREDISGWKVSRVADGKAAVDFVFPANSFLDPEGSHKEIIIWALGKKPAGSADLEAEHESWGVGASIVTKLYDVNGDEKASHTQSTTFSSS